MKVPSITSAAPARRIGLPGSMSAGNASKSMCLTISARRSVNSGRPIAFASAFDMDWNCGDDGLVAKLGSRPRSVSRTVWMLDMSTAISWGVCAVRSLQRAITRSSGGVRSPCARLSSPNQATAAVRAPPEVPLKPTISKRS